MKIYLYSTAGCHLCDLAKAILWPLLAEYEYRLLEVEIADDDELISRYGTRIPVLAAAEIERELNWPFTTNDIKAFLLEVSSV